MWTYDGQTIVTPTFLLGTGPAGNLVSTVSDLGGFISFVFADGRGPSGALIKPELLRSMIEPQLGKPGEAPGFGLGFAISKLGDERRIGHGGAVYGFATEVEALPDAKLGAAVVAAADCANGIARHIAETALRLMLAVRQGRLLPRLPTSGPIASEAVRQLEGRYATAGKFIDITERRGQVFLSPNAAGMTVEIRQSGDTLVVDDRLASGPKLTAFGNRIRIGNASYEKKSVEKPAPCPDRWDGLIGEYGWDHDVLYVLEKDGQLHVLIEWFFDYPLTELGPDRFLFPDYGLYAGRGWSSRGGTGGGASQVEAAGVVFPRRRLDGEGGKTFRNRAAPAHRADSGRDPIGPTADRAG